MVHRNVENLLLYIFYMYLDPGHWHVKIGINSLLVTWSGDHKKKEKIKNNCKNCYWLDLEICTFSRSKININNFSVIETDTRKGP